MICKSSLLGIFFIEIAFGGCSVLEAVLFWTDRVKKTLADELLFTVKLTYNAPHVTK